MFQTERTALQGFRVEVDVALCGKNVPVAENLCDRRDGDSRFA
jgi:hypothetical protein